MARTKTYTCCYCLEKVTAGEACDCYLCDAGPFHRACYEQHRIHCG